VSRIFALGPELDLALVQHHFKYPRWWPIRLGLLRSGKKFFAFSLLNPGTVLGQTIEDDSLKVTINLKSPIDQYSRSGVSGSYALHLCAY
jgi:hypothetical protein